ncbi:MAG: outer membrane protein assembly factor BamA [Deferribacteraceae bacterium]|jgi:outer membrane protein insertion porin family|nr:outer membrane protein assembly factor BamA [Deferribacteraceae bacterium]
MRGFLALLILLLFSSLSYAVTIDRVAISGNKRIPDSRIVPYLMTAGSEFDPVKINSTVKKLHETGYFSEINVDADVQGSEFVLTYMLQETPLIAFIDFNGNDKVTDETLMGLLAVEIGGALNLTQLGLTVKNIQDNYENEQYYNVKIDYTIQYRNENSVNLIFDIEEGKRSRVYNIWFYGNEKFSDDELKAVMQTQEKDFWSFMNSSGTVMRDKTELDRELLRQFYLSKGYAQVEIGEQEIAFQQDPARMNYLVRIKEGPKFTVSNIRFVNKDNEYTAAELEAATTLKAGGDFDVSAYQNDLRKLTDLYTERGYANANIDGQVLFEQVGNAVNITYNVEEGNIFKVNRIIFTGNEVTRDNVLRREFDISEGETYNSKLLQEGQANLYTTGYYELVNISERNADGDSKDIIVDVKERKLGSLNLIISYSSAEELGGRFEVARANVFGFGSTARASAEFTEDRRDFVLGYDDPWVLDKPYSASFEVYSRSYEYEDQYYSQFTSEYDKTLVGGVVSVGHQPIKRRLFMRYALSHDEITISDVSDRTSEYVKRQEGFHIVNAFTPSISYSKLDNNIDPTNGLKMNLSTKFAGTVLGGDSDFIKLLVGGTYYKPIVNSFVGTLHVEGGQIWSLSDEPLPIEERFVLGGMYSVRGFNSREISPKDSNGEPYGGNKYYQANLELWRPIFDGNLTIRGVMFLDIGQVYDEDQAIFSTPPRKTLGAGIRFFTPMGLIRLEYGYKLDKKEDEDQALWEFSIGSAF